jgi:hypothetical protein
MERRENGINLMKQWMKSKEIRWNIRIF